MEVRLRGRISVTQIARNVSLVHGGVFIRAVVTPILGVLYGTIAFLVGFICIGAEANLRVEAN